MNLSMVLSESEIERVDAAAETLLEDMGFGLQDPEGLDACAKAGADVDKARGIVRLPKPLLRELIAQAPSSYTIRGIDGSAHEIGTGEQWGVGIITDPWVIDYPTQKPRKPRLEDIRRHTILGQKLDHIATISRMDYPVADVEGPASTYRAWEEYLVHTGKHYNFAPANRESLDQWRAILDILTQGEDPRGKGLFSVMVSIVSPLKMSRLNMDFIRLCAEYGATVVPTCCPMAGSTGTYTLAGTLVQGHAENLAVGAVTQIMAPGLPFLYSFGPSVTDMTTGEDLYYTMDKVLWKIGGVQMAKHRGLPTTAECGGTMTYRYDVQNGAEGILFMLGALSSGADFLAGFGSCYTAMGMSAEMMLIQGAWLDAAKYLQRGIRFDDEHLALDNIRQAGPGGEFLTDALTLQYMHGGEMFQSELFDMSPCGAEGKSMLERAHEKAEELVAEYESPVPEPVQEQLHRYFHDLCGTVAV